MQSGPMHWNHISRFLSSYIWQRHMHQSKPIHSKCKMHSLDHMLTPYTAQCMMALHWKSYIRKEKCCPATTPAAAAATPMSCSGRLGINKFHELHGVFSFLIFRQIGSSFCQFWILERANKKQFQKCLLRVLYAFNQTSVTHSMFLQQRNIWAFEEEKIHTSEKPFQK